MTSAVILGTKNALGRPRNWTMHTARAEARQRGYPKEDLLLREGVLPVLELEVLARNKVPRAGDCCKREGEEDEAGGELHDCRSAGV